MAESLKWFHFAGLMKMKFSVYLQSCLLCLFASVPGAWGQVPEEPVQVTFTCLADFGLYAETKIDLPKGTVDLGISSMYRTKEYRYVGAPEMVFYREMTNAEGQIVRVTDVAVTIPSDLYNQRVLIYFQKSASTDQVGPRYRAYVMDDRLSNFPVGSRKIFNMSDHIVGVKLGDSTAVVEPQASIVIKADETSEDGLLEFRMVGKGDDGWQRLKSLQVPDSTTKRWLVFVTPDPRGKGRIRTRTVADIPDIKLQTN